MWGLGDGALIPLSPVQAVSLQTMERFSSLLRFPSPVVAIRIPDFQDGFGIPMAWHGGRWALPLLGHTFCREIALLTSAFLLSQRKSLIALEKEDEEERNKTIESLKTALRTKPMRQFPSLSWLYRCGCDFGFEFSGRAGG